MTVNTTVDSDGNITAAAVNAGGSDYLITDTVTITNANAGKVLSLATWQHWQVDQTMLQELL